MKRKILRKALAYLKQQGYEVLAGESWRIRGDWAFIHVYKRGRYYAATCSWSSFQIIIEVLRRKELFHVDDDSIS